MYLYIKKHPKRKEKKTSEQNDYKKKVNNMSSAVSIALNC